MINVSREFSDTMRKRTDFKEYADITLADGTVINLSASDFTVSNNYMNDGAGASQIPLGAAIERNIQIEIMNDQEQYSTYDFYGAVIELYLTFQLSETVEKVVYGRFKVITPETYGETVIITAVDDMYKADKPYSTSLAFPATTGAMLREICEKCDLPLGSTTFQNSDFVVNTAPDSSYTFRAVIGFIAMIAGGNARINRWGELEIITYNFSILENLRGYDGGTFKPWESNADLDGGSFNPWNTGDVADAGLFTDYDGIQVLYNWKNLKVDTDDIVITGIKTAYTDENDNELEILEGSEGYVLGIENPLIAGKEAEAVALIGAVMIGGKYRKFEGDHISYPIAEFMDPVFVVDRRSNVYQSIITDVNFTFCGFTTIKNSSESAIRNSSQFLSESVKTYVAARKMVAKERTERQKAVEQLAYKLAHSSGLYITVEELEDGSSIYYMHDKPTLNESMIVWKLTALAFGISTDGGKTYPYGFSVNGELIARLLYAEGINADYINSGTINADMVNISSSCKRNSYISFTKIDGGSYKISSYSVDESIDKAILCAELTSDIYNNGGNFALYQGGKIKIGMNGMFGIRIYDDSDIDNTVELGNRNNRGIIELFDRNTSDIYPYFYVGRYGDTDVYDMKFSAFRLLSSDKEEGRFLVGDQIVLECEYGQRTGYFDQLHVNDMKMTTLAWVWSNELTAYVLTGMQ